MARRPDRIAEARGLTVAASGDAGASGDSELWIMRSSCAPCAQRLCVSLFTCNARTARALSRLERAHRMRIAAAAAAAAAALLPGIALACSLEAVTQLRQAFDQGLCGAAALAPDLNVHHMVVANPARPLRTPRFSSINAPSVAEDDDGALPPTGLRLYAGTNPWNARGGLDTIRTVTRMMLRGDGDESAVFESPALTLVSLFLQDAPSARHRFVCAVAKEQEFLNEPKTSWSDLVRFVNGFVPSSDHVEKQVLRSCPALPILARRAVDSARNCSDVAGRLARFLIDQALTVDPLAIFNNETLDHHGEFHSSGPLDIVCACVFVVSLSLSRARPRLGHNNKKKARPCPKSRAKDVVRVRVASPTQQQRASQNCCPTRARVEANGPQRY